MAKSTFISEQYGFLLQSIELPLNLSNNYTHLQQYHSDISLELVIMKLTHVANNIY